MTQTLFTIGTRFAYEVAYDAEADSLVCRHLHWVPQGAYYGDPANIFGRRRDGALVDVLVREHQDWRPAEGTAAFTEELLEQGRRLAKEAEEAEAARMAAKADKAARPSLSIEVKGGKLTIDGELINVDEELREAFLNGEPGFSLDYPCRRLAQEVSQWLFDEPGAPFVSAYNTKAGVKVVVSAE